MLRVIKTILFWAIIAAALISAFWAGVAMAHDLWISREGWRNAAGEWCCGEGDCFVVPSDQVSIVAGGYLLFGQELVPQQEAMPSPDGVYWRCMRPDGSRRCFFAPPSAF